MTEDFDEPVLWLMPDGNTVDKWGLQFYKNHGGEPPYGGHPLYKKPQTEDAPVAIADGSFNCNAPIGTPLYARPQPTAKWVGLTDTDIGNEYVRFEIQGGFNRFDYAVRALEAKLKEKNT